MNHQVADPCVLELHDMAPTAVDLTYVHAFTSNLSIHRIVYSSKKALRKEISGGAGMELAI